MKYLKYVIVFSALLIFSSCSKDDNEANLSMDNLTGLSSVAIFNTIPGSSSLTLSTGREPNVNWLISSSQKFDFNSFITYKNWYPGILQLNVNYSYEGNKKQSEKTVSLEHGKVYSLFLTKDSEVQAILSEDNIIKPSKGMAKVRFVHTSADAPNISAAPTHFSNLLFPNVKFKEVTPFQEIAISNMNLWSITSNDISNRLDIQNEFKLEEGQIYTLLLKGLVNTNNADEEISLSVIKH